MLNVFACYFLNQTILPIGYYYSLVASNMQYILQDLNLLGLRDKV